VIFTELRFFVFFAAVWSTYWSFLSTPSGRKLWLLCSSYLFYAAWDARFLALIMGSTVVDYFAGRAIGNSESESVRRGGLWASVIVNLGALAFFKYAGFFLDSAVDLHTLLGFTAHRPTLNIILPVGISFYTFQTLSYTIDIYRRRLEPVDDFLDFALFVSFFPQLVAGPIVRASTFLPQLQTPKTWSAIDVRGALWLFSIGWFKKSVIADNAATLSDTFYAAPVAYDALSAWLATLLYAVQIYADFSGYTDMAIGCAALLGYNLTLNFDAPYLSADIQQFWRRWHISLSTWLRDYLYISLGGSRRGQARTYVNLMVTMLLGGLWHGASWNFVIWGFLHGLALIVHKGWQGAQRRFGAPELPQILGIALTFAWVCMAWVFFRATDLSDAITTVGIMTGFASGGSSVLPMRWWLVVLFAGTVHIAYRAWVPKDWYRRSELGFGLALGVVISATLSWMIPTARPFVYFQF
jgi:alginate O-acetyltransferase complex protein AlgI